MKKFNSERNIHSKHKNHQVNSSPFTFDYLSKVHNSSYSIVTKSTAIEAILKRKKLIMKLYKGVKKEQKKDTR